MALWHVLGLVALLALARPVSADDLDDLDLGPPPGPASAAPPAPAAPAAPGKIEDDDDFLKGAPLLGGTPGGASVIETESPAPSVLPGGLRDAWNLVTTLAFLREAKLDSRPQEAPFKSWQALRVSQELTAILAGATDVPGPLKTLIQRRAEGLLGRKQGGEEPEIEDELDLGPGPAKPAGAAAPALTALPAAALDEQVERLSRQLAVLDRSDLSRAQDVARDLAQRAGDASVSTRLAAAAVHGPDLVPFTDRIRTLVHAPPGAAWVIRQLASREPGSVQAALDYMREGAGLAEVREVLAAVAAGRIGEAAAAPLIQSVGALATVEALPELEKVSAAGLGRAVGEAVGRIRQRAEELASWRSGYGNADRRDAASRINQAGLPLFRAGNYREALLKFRAACELDPSEATYRYNQGSALCRLGNVTEGLEHLRQAIAIGRDEMPFYEAALGAMRDLGKRSEIVAYLEERAPRVQYSAVVVLVYLNLAHEYVSVGRATEAHQALDIAFARAVPERYLTALLARRGDAFMLSGDVAHARRTYQKALEYAPENRRALDGMLRADAWQPAGSAGAGTAGTELLVSPIDDGGLSLELDAPSPTASVPAAPPAPAPKASPSPASDPLDDLDI